MAEHVTRADAERVRGQALALAEEALVRRVGRALVHALAWRAGRFQPWEIEQATGVPSLTLAAADYGGNLADARRELARTLAVTPPVATLPQAKRALPLLLALREHRAQAGR